MLVSKTEILVTRFWRDSILLQRNLTNVQSLEVWNWTKLLEQQQQLQKLNLKGLTYQTKRVTFESCLFKAGFVFMLLTTNYTMVHLVTHGGNNSKILLFLQV